MRWWLSLLVVVALFGDAVTATATLPRRGNRFLAVMTSEAGAVSTAKLRVGKCGTNYLGTPPYGCRGRFRACHGSACGTVSGGLFFRADFAGGPFFGLFRHGKDCSLNGTVDDLTRGQYQCGLSGSSPGEGGYFFEHERGTFALTPVQ
ncbi:MAG TPA: hypothetical protein VGR62_16350 [Candidatus Binatia bacterium]|jgi:hypothetical protein|nr:hypothetical protein [Candidatus Binatia bacterium]